MPRRLGRVILPLIAISLAACDVLGGIAPPPAPTEPPTLTPAAAPSPTVTPTLGPREYIDAAYCWPSPVDTGSFDLLRFFPDGTVLNAGVAPFESCQAAWDQMRQYMTPDQLMTFNHGEYYLSGGVIRFELARAQTNTSIGEVFGTLEAGKMILIKGGAVQEYIVVD